MWTTEQAAQELLHLLPLLNRVMIAELRKEDGDDTTMPQFRVLSALAETPLTLSAIAQMRRVSLQSAGELVQALVARGWVVRSPDPTDRRQAHLALTPAGIQQQRQASSRMQGRLIPLLANLSETEMDAVRQALPALQRVLMEGNPDDSD